MIMDPMMMIMNKIVLYSFLVFLYNTLLSVSSENVIERIIA